MYEIEATWRSAQTSSGLICPNLCLWKCLTLCYERARIPEEEVTCRDLTVNQESTQNSILTRVQRNMNDDVKTAPHGPDWMGRGTLIDTS